MSTALLKSTAATPLELAVVSMQRVLLGTLLLAHFTLPYLLKMGRENQLLLDSLFPSQLCLLVIALAFCDLKWVGAGLLLVAAVINGVGWLLAYPPHLHSYAVMNSVVPLAVLAVALIGIRLRGYRGSWQQNETNLPAPWQVSIRLLMSVTAVVAISCAAATFVRGVAAFGTASSGLMPALVTFAADGVCTTLICLTALWAAGTRGAGVAKFLVLLAVATVVVMFQIYAFRMETFWHLPLFMSSCWIVVTCGSLYVWRACGWQVVRLNSRPVRI